MATQSSWPKARSHKGCVLLKCLREATAWGRGGRDSETATWAHPTSLECDVAWPRPDVRQLKFYSCPFAGGTSCIQGSMLLGSDVLSASRRMRVTFSAVLILLPPCFSDVLSTPKRFSKQTESCPLKDWISCPLHSCVCFSTLRKVLSIASSVDMRGNMTQQYLLLEINDCSWTY